ncbi:MAG: hypothetical protein AAF532_08250 [Planctomycetota bacterium]
MWRHPVRWLIVSAVVLVLVVPSGCAGPRAARKKRLASARTRPAVAPADRGRSNAEDRYASAVPYVPGASLD